jgi:hypothetical protein
VQRDVHDGGNGKRTFARQQQHWNGLRFPERG